MPARESSATERAIRVASPDPTEIRAEREAAALTQTAASAIAYSSLRAWQQWEAGDRRMHPAIWQWWLYRTARRRARGAQQASS